MDVAAWLQRLGLGQYEPAFRDHAVDGEVLAGLTPEDLKDIGVAAVGHRRKLLDAIAALRAGAEARPASAGLAEVVAAGFRPNFSGTPRNRSAVPSTDG